MQCPGTLSLATGQLRHSAATRLLMSAARWRQRPQVQVAARPYWGRRRLRRLRLGTLLDWAPIFSQGSLVRVVPLHPGDGDRRRRANVTTASQPPTDRCPLLQPGVESGPLLRDRCSWRRGSLPGNVTSAVNAGTITLAGVGNITAQGSERSGRSAHGSFTTTMAACGR